ncbi:MAG: hypothetical protein AABX65_01170 [Nanoarchaeota archaeon]
MEKTFIAVRDVDREEFRKFKAISIRERLKLGEALTIAMRRFIEERVGRKNKGVKSLLMLKPFDFGEGSERLSKEVEKILYG